MDEDALSPETFSGTARLFPLPNLVLFPSVVQPLHIFEPRYRQMMADALDDDRLLTPVLLRPGFEQDYELRPAIHSVACIGRVFKEERLPDGRYNLLLHGLSRVKIVDELVTSKLYRVAKVELMRDLPLSSPAEERRLRKELGKTVLARFEELGGGEAADHIEKLLRSDMDLGPLCDIFAFALPLDDELKQALLEEVNINRRVRLLVSRLADPIPQPVEPGQRFPPSFSDN